MRLDELLRGLSAQQLPTLTVGGLAADARQLQSGEVFLAYLTPTCDRRHYIADAVAAGAAAILYEAEGFSGELPATVPAIAVPHLSAKLGILADRYYQQPSAHLPVIGVTGTNGKSSIVHFLAQAFDALAKPAAMIGTLGNGRQGLLEKSKNTTPSVLDVHRLCRQFLQQAVEVVAMEVSSHALVQGRVQGLRFDTAVFTQLSRDHLDYHRDMASYAKAKQQLFEQPGLKRAVFNVDDAYGTKWAQHYADRLHVVTTSCRADHPSATVKLKQWQRLPGGYAITVQTPWGEVATSLHLLGDFNLSNVLAVIAVLGLQGFAMTEVALVLRSLSSVPGRMQCFGGQGQAQVVVDYAHTPDALEKALQSLRPFCSGRLFCVFGCGGERDVGKRPLMAATAERWADCLILTDDNPRGEDPGQIIRDMLKGLLADDHVAVVHQRDQAIKQAIAQASSGDVVLVAGKGHETEQIIGSDVWLSDDREWVQQALAEKEKIGK